MKRFGPDDVKAGDVIEVLVAHNGTDQRKSMRERRRCRVVWAGPKFVTALVPRGAGSARESFAYDKILAVNPKGLAETVIGDSKVAAARSEQLERDVVPGRKEETVPVKRVDEAMLQKILELHEKGLTQMQIAAKVGLSQSTVGRCIRQAKGDPAPKQGRTAEPEPARQTISREEVEEIVGRGLEDVRQEIGVRRLELRRHIVKETQAPKPPPPSIRELSERPPFLIERVRDWLRRRRGA